MVQNVLGVNVIGAERHPPGGQIVLGQHPAVFLQKMSHRGLPNHDVHSPAKFVGHLVGRIALVVGPDVHRGQGREVLPGGVRRAPVDPQVVFVRHGQRFQGVLVPFVDEFLDRLPDPHAFVPVLSFPMVLGGHLVSDRGRRQGVRSFKRDAPEDLHWRLPGFVKKIPYPLQSSHHKDLIQAGDHRGGPPGNDQLGKPSHRQFGTFNVNVTVHQPRHQVGIPCVQHLGSVSPEVIHLPDPGDFRTDHGHIIGSDLPGVYVDQPSVFNDQVSRVLPLNRVRQFLVHRSSSRF